MLYEVTRRVLENGMKVLGIKPATEGQVLFINQLLLKANIYAD
jgi:hypothetical protein